MKQRRETMRKKMLGIRRLLGWMLALGLGLGFGALAPALQSSSLAAPVFCRVVDGHSVCVLSLQRSAKNFWEYRAAVSVDGVVRPVEVYDCRDRLRHKADGTTVSFSRDLAGAIVCRLYKR
ncbi:hypothetical protein [Thermoleptolyngbya oregonensis]|uniref:hypothetical protein n=1 Tax=Thermoleptolyngbya oregonensis TaxID=2303529 RepID=UPI00292E68BA|nr:hypothetical protein [Thermoleptolyngbya oregonensis]